MLEDMTPPQRIYPCAIRTACDGLSETDRKILLDAVSNTSWPVLTLRNELKSRGVNVTERGIYNHRRKICSCSKI